MTSGLARSGTAGLVLLGAVACAASSPANSAAPGTARQNAVPTAQASPVGRPSAPAAVPVKDTGRAGSPAPTRPSEPAATGQSVTMPGTTSTRCPTSSLTLRIGTSDGAAGSVYTTIALRNTGSRPCSLTGYPGVSLLDNTGHQLGQPAARLAPTSPAFILRSGHAATFQLRVVDATCTTNSPRSRQIRVLPPNQRDELTAPFDSAVCATPSVTALHP